MVNKKYQRRRNGSEYYLKGSKPFVIDPGGKERYARDKNGNELYPKSKNNHFARDQNFREYYARDSLKNEFYPRRKGYSVVIQTEDGYRMARLANGLERYPIDGRGNEYYLNAEGKPILIYQEDGKPCFAKTKRGLEQIPWNVSQEYVTDTNLFTETTDAVGNSVFIGKSRTNLSNLFCQCLCEMMAVCPSVGIIVASTLLN